MLMIIISIIKKIDSIFISELCYVLAGGFMVWCGVLRTRCGGLFCARKSRATFQPQSAPGLNHNCAIVYKPKVTKKT